MADRPEIEGERFVVAMQQGGVELDGVAVDEFDVPPFTRRRRMVDVIDVPPRPFVAIAPPNESIEESSASA